MGTFTNSEDPDEMPHKTDKKKRYIRTKTQFLFKLYPDTLDMYNGIPQFIVSNQKENPLVNKALKAGFLDPKQGNSYLYEAVSGRSLPPIIYNSSSDLIKLISSMIIELSTIS